MAESLKYGVIADSELFRQIASGGFEDRELLPSLVARCVAIKAELVKTDERDKGARQLLNFGHTPGHGIELCSEYTIPHGHAVAAGMAVMTRAAERAGICPPGSAAQLEGALERYGLPVLSPFSPEELAVAARRDKKRRGEQITLVLPERIGHCVLHSVPVEELTRWFQMGEER